MAWIQAAMASALSRYSAYPIDFKMVNYVQGKDYSERCATHLQPAPHTSHSSLPSTADSHSARFLASPSQMAMPSGCPIPTAKKLLVTHLEDLWETAYNTAKASGAIDLSVFSEIKKLREDGTLMDADVVSWINRRREASGYTLLHQVAWHGNYEQHKKERAQAVPHLCFLQSSKRMPFRRSSSAWVPTWNF